MSATLAPPGAFVSRRFGTMHGTAYGLAAELLPACRDGGRLPVPDGRPGNTWCLINDVSGGRCGKKTWCPINECQVVDMQSI